MRVHLMLCFFLAKERALHFQRGDQKLLKFLCGLNLLLDLLLILLLLLLPSQGAKYRYIYRSSKENCSISFDDDVLICHGRDIGSSSCATSQNDRNLGNPLTRHLSHIVEDSSEVSFCWKDIALSREVSSS